MQAFDGGISKLFEVISRISKNDIDIEIDGKHLHYEKPQKIKISPTFTLLVTTLLAILISCLVT